ncbi:MAG: RICIN domain-containing protein [Mucilaginibacter sp.]
MRNKFLLCLTTAGVLLMGSCKKTESPVKNASPDGPGKKGNGLTGQVIVNGTYKISNVSSGFAASYVTNGANPQLMVQNTYSALNNNQRWTITAIDATYYKIINVTLGKALSAFNTTTGWQLELRPYTGTDDKQKWKIEYVAAGGGASAGYRLIAKASLGLSAAASSNTAGVSIINSTTATNNFQRWNFAVVAYQDDVVTNYFKRTTGSQAFDGNFSIPLSDGRVLWLTNDVFYNQLNGSGMLPCLFNNHNSVLTQPTATNWTAASTTTYAASGQPNVPNGSPQIFWHLDPNKYLWPGAGIQIGNYAYIYCNEIQNVSGGFSVTGAFLANLNLTNMQVNYQSLTALNGINFGIGMIQSGSYVYVYGYKNAGLGSNIYVARFATSTPGTWTYWDGSAWVASSASAAIIGSAASNGAYVGKVNGKYVLISTAFTWDCDDGTDIFSSFTSNLTGPFSAMKVIYSIPDRNAGHTPFFYAPIVHPQATVAGSNEFLFTYCINYYEPCVTRCVGGQQDPNGYRPRGVRVPYSVIDPSF